MKRETIAIHGGFDSDPTTKAVAVPIYQTAAYSFESAEHGAALFNLEVEGYRYTGTTYTLFAHILSRIDFKTRASTAMSRAWVHGTSRRRVRADRSPETDPAGARRVRIGCAANPHRGPYRPCAARIARHNPCRRALD